MVEFFGIAYLISVLEGTVADPTVASVEQYDILPL